MHGIQGPSELRITGAEDAGTVTPEQAERVRLLAAEFESLLLTHMLKEMRASMLGDEKESGFGGNPLSESMFSELSLALSRAGGIGIADAMLAPMLRQTATGMHPPSALTITAADAHAIDTIDVPAMVPSPALGPAEQFGGRVTSAYGWREDPIEGSRRFHAGTDVALPVGSVVPAARSGRVAFAGELPGYGLTVLVEHGGRMATRYAHLSEISVEAGQQVAAGQAIARSGATGRVTGPHLHFEVLEGGKPVDPDHLFTPAPASFGQ